MKRKLTSILLFSALLAGGASTFVSCTDNESDNAYNTSISLADAIAKQTKDLEDLNAELQKKADKTTVEALKTALEGRIKANEDAIVALNNSAVGDLAKYATLDAAIQGSKAYTDLKQEVEDHIKAIEDLRTKDEAAAKKFTEALETRLQKIEGSVSSETEARKKVQAVYDQAFDYLVNKKLDNIAINATDNPVLGYYNAAFVGSQLNLAASFYGTAQYGSKTMGVEQGEFLNTGDAGKIFVTLNPIEIAPECISKLQLVDSQGNEAKGFELGDLENTDKVLTYGYTRAAELSANGFYAIPVKAVDPQNDDFSLNKGELKEAAKNVLAKLKNPKTSNLNLSQVATALYSSVNNKLKAYTVKATYYLYDPTIVKEDGSKGEFVEKHQVAPTYNMAAFAVKPLSYNTLKDNQSLANLGVALDKYMLPTLSDKVNEYIKALDFKIEYEGSHPVEVVSLLVASNKMKVTEDQEKKEVQILDNDGNVMEIISNATLETHILDKTSSDSEILYVIKTTDNTVDDTINDLLGQLNDQIGTQLQPVKDAIQNAAEKWDNAIAPVNNLLHKINANISDVNQLLQPTMLYKSTKTNSWNTLSTLKGKLGTRMTGTGSTVLVATSWTAELLAPAYKKSVYVKEAGANVTLMDGKTSAKTPFDGSVQKVLFNATKAGNYTVVYTAVDYSGVETTKEYNITVE